MLIELDSNQKPQKGHVIMNDEIKNLKILSEEQVDLENLFDETLEIDSNATIEVNIKEKRLNLMNWLKKNHVPLNNNEDDETINIMDTVYIHKPYNVDNCESLNEIILDKITSLVKQFNSIK